MTLPDPPAPESLTTDVTGGPLNWVDDPAATPGLAGFDPAVQLAASMFASQVLWGLSGRRYGLTEVLVRPVSPWLNEPWAKRWSYRQALSGTPYLPFSAEGWDRLTHLRRTELPLPGRVHRVLEVWVDGALLASSKYEVDSARLLRRLDGEVWPVGQDLRVPLTTAGTLGVRYQAGLPVPAGGADAAGTLAVEVAKAMSGQKCALPRNARSVTRQGVSVDLGDPQSLAKDGKTGLWLVDLWVHSVNPYGQVEPSAVYSVDVTRASRTTT